MPTIPLELCTSDAERFGLTQCGHCGDLLHQEEATVAVYYNDEGQQTEHFCGENCKQRWYIKRLNSLGM